MNAINMIKNKSNNFNVSVLTNNKLLEDALNQNKP